MLEKGESISLYHGRDTQTDDFRPFADASDYITFPPGSSLPIHFVHWRIPVNSSYTVSPTGHPNTLRLSPSKLNLTAYDGNYAGPGGQTFVGRRQTDTLFTFSVNLQFSPQAQGDEAGISVFLTQASIIFSAGFLCILMFPEPPHRPRDRPLTEYKLFRITPATSSVLPLLSDLLPRCAAAITCSHTLLIPELYNAIRSKCNHVEPISRD